MSAPRQPNFDRVAHVYRWSEYLALGPLLQQVRTRLVDQLRMRRQALVLGDGDGRFLAQLLRCNEGLTAHAVDLSATMLALLRRRCQFAADRLTTQQASLLDVLPSAGTDLVVTHFVLDCLPQADVDCLAARMAEDTEPGTLWVVSDFGVPESRLLRPLAAVYVRGLYFAFRVLTGLRVTSLPDPQAALAQAGFLLRERHTWLTGCLYTELWERGYNQQGSGIQWAMSEESLPTPPNDAQSQPEPAVPSLAEPDPAVFHHDVDTAPKRND